MLNIKTKKHIGVDDDGDVEIRTVDIPYQARQAKLALDESNIYRFGMGVNTDGLKDTSASFGSKARPYRKRRSRQRSIGGANTQPHEISL